jgi:hypothetical protein
MKCKTIDDAKTTLSKVMDDLYAVRREADGKYFESLTIAIETVAERKRMIVDLTELETVADEDITPW